MLGYQQGRGKVPVISVDTGRRRGWVLPATLFVAFVLHALPVNDPLQGFVPDWVSLVLIYWSLALPGRMSVGAAWAVGLLLDLVSFGLLGSYALTKAVLVYFSRRAALQVRTYPLWQQAVVVLVLLAVEMLLLVVIEFAVEQSLHGLERWTAAVVGALLWPIAYLLLRRCRLWAQLS